MSGRSLAAFAPLGPAEEVLLDGLAARGLWPDPALMRSDGMTEAFGYRTARELLRGPARPTAFLTSSLISAIGVRRALEEAGLRMGRDISVVTHDDVLSYLRNGEEVAIFTATRSSVREAGRRAAAMLIGLIEEPGAGPKHELLEAELVLGGSTGPAPQEG